MAAALSGGPGTLLSDTSAAALWTIGEERERTIHLTVPPGRQLRQPLLAVHRRSLTFEEATVHDFIPVTSPIRTLIDIATVLRPWKLEAAVNEADKLDLVDPEALRAALGERRGVRGTARLRELLDRRTLALTDSELERRFLPLAARAGLSPPCTQRWLHGFRADFYWPDLGLVVETDGLRYHRTPAQQARDRRRDQAFTAAGLVILRFTHAQVFYESAHVAGTLRRVAHRLEHRV